MWLEEKKGKNFEIEDYSYLSKKHNQLTNSRILPSCGENKRHNFSHLIINIPQRVKSRLLDIIVSCVCVCVCDFFKIMGLNSSISNKFSTLAQRKSLPMAKVVHTLLINLL